MTVEKWNKKLDYFAETFENEVRTRKNIAKHKLAKQLKAFASAEISKAERNAHRAMLDASRAITRDANRQLATIEHKEKLILEEVRAKLDAEVLEEVEQELSAFVKTAEYREYLLSAIEKAAQKYDFKLVKLTARDMILKDEIEAATGLIAEVYEADVLGGFVLTCENGKVTADFTFSLLFS